MADAAIRELKGGNLDLDLLPNSAVSWHQDRCPWNEADQTNEHKCAIKSVSICKYFKGIKPLDTILCSFPNES